MKKNIQIIVCLVLTLAFFGCRKFLDVKPDKKLVVPSTVADAQALLNDTYMFITPHPGSGEIAAGDFFFKTEDWKAISTPSVRNSYIWSEDVFNEHERNEWSVPYIGVYTANVILDALQENRIIDGSVKEKENIRGTALFYRSYIFYNLLQLFSKAWDANTAKTDLGIALRLVSDLNTPTRRASVQECYDKIISDITFAIDLLPELTSVKTMPTKAAAYAFLARIHLNMGSYSTALENAGKALNFNTATLLDYNSVDSVQRFPFSRFNNEVIFHSLINTSGSLYPPTMKVDSTLLSLYAKDDLRTGLFFQQNTDNTYSFKGSYEGSAVLFGGLTVAELYLIRAECYARNNEVTKSMDDLNTLLFTRWRKGTFVKQTALSADDALKIVLMERRKELAFRAIRWSDLKRLNKDPKYAVTLKRIIENTEFTLLHNDNRYAFPIPRSIIELTGIEQNPR